MVPSPVKLRSIHSKVQRLGSCVDVEGQRAVPADCKAALIAALAGSLGVGPLAVMAYPAVVTQPHVNSARLQSLVSRSTLNR